MWLLTRNTIQYRNKRDIENLSMFSSQLTSRVIQSHLTDAVTLGPKYITDIFYFTSFMKIYNMYCMYDLGKIWTMYIFGKKYIFRSLNSRPSWVVVVKTMRIFFSNMRTRHRAKQEVVWTRLLRLLRGKRQRSTTISVNNNNNPSLFLPTKPGINVSIL